MNQTSYSPNVNENNIVFGDVTTSVHTPQQSYEGYQQSYEGYQQSYEGQHVRINPIPMNGCLYNLCQSQNLENNSFKQFNNEKKQTSFVNQENSFKGEITPDIIYNDVFNIQQLLNEFQNQYITRSDYITFRLLTLTLQSLLHITFYMKKLESEKLINSKPSTNETKGSESSKTDLTKSCKGQKAHTKEDEKKLHSSDSESSDSESSYSDSDSESSDSEDEESSTESDSPSDREIRRQLASKHAKVHPVGTVLNSFREIAPLYLKKKNKKFEKKQAKELFYYNNYSNEEEPKVIRNKIIEAMNNTNISLFILTLDSCVATFSKQKSEAEKGWNEDDSFKIYQLVKNREQCYVELKSEEHKSFEINKNPLYDILTAYGAFSITGKLEICYKPDGDISGTLPYTVVVPKGSNPLETLGGNPRDIKEKIERILIVKWY
ncbi:hypothetical protein CL6EHI_185250 [Entamoeba histolytica]|uniref:Uncharacterized protein n=4 Tax=Entamoeba histolytica TaxID=5759 RepID=C4M3Z3_ENTH1|nr:hypothetical protein EHI_185250 [Entamoeba histolytica HM-1:IMSS]EAL50784.1 hypothetical protein EHI_185250 [Entamoeba histolytica HM-1:IMSS]GAT96060.1 hypothetical protein CL6EHI_185250 [Entamoeba histolytica]|eukprot:XP_656170.1 hypothetical protein EHI_185250 [Entamoeba histolytica HM-1:IMSS]